MKNKNPELSHSKKWEILKSHIFQGVSIDDLCKENGITEDEFHSWQKNLLDYGEFALIRAEAAISSKHKKPWHRVFSSLHEKLLTPLGIDVYTDFPVMAKSPELDIMIIRRTGKKWTKEQMDYLPDGIRDSKAKYNIIEFKYTESVNENAFIQALCYDFLFKNSRKLKESEVQTFLASSKTTQNKTLKLLKCTPGNHKGLYNSEKYDKITLISLNDLTNTHYNAYFKFFSSKKREKASSFKLLENRGIKAFSKRIQWLIRGLFQFWFTKKGDKEMEFTPTPEQLEEFGKKWGDTYLSNFSADEIIEKFGEDTILSKFDPKKRVKGLSFKDRLKDIPVKDRLKDISVKDRLKDIPVKDRLKDIPVKDRLKDVPVEDYLKDVPVEDILAFLQQTGSLKR